MPPATTGNMLGSPSTLFHPPTLLGNHPTARNFASFPALPTASLQRAYALLGETLQLGAHRPGRERAPERIGRLRPLRERLERNSQSDPCLRVRIPDAQRALVGFDRLAVARKALQHGAAQRVELGVAGGGARRAVQGRERGRIISRRSTSMRARPSANIGWAGLIASPSCSMRRAASRLRCSRSNATSAWRAASCAGSCASAAASPSSASEARPWLSRTTARRYSASARSAGVRTRSRFPLGPRRPRLQAAVRVEAISGLSFHPRGSPWRDSPWRAAPRRTQPAGSRR